jgi:hypothetical protein
MRELRSVHASGRGSPPSSSCSTYADGARHRDRDRRRTRDDHLRRKDRRIATTQRNQPARVDVQVQRRSRVRPAVAAVIELARKHLRTLPENLACPPGCAECCSGYEPFVSKADVQRIADHFGISYEKRTRRLRRAAAIGRRITMSGTCVRSTTTSRASAFSCAARARATTTAGSTNRVRSIAARSRRSAATTSIPTSSTTARSRRGVRSAPSTRPRCPNKKKM